MSNRSENTVKIVLRADDMASAKLEKLKEGLARTERVLQRTFRTTERWNKEMARAVTLAQLYQAATGKTSASSRGGSEPIRISGNVRKVNNKRASVWGSLFKLGSMILPEFIKLKKIAILTVH